MTFHLVCASWILFRAPDFSSAWEYVSNMADPSGLLEGASGAVLLFPGILVMVLIDVWQRRSRQEVPWMVAPARQGFLAGVATAGIVLFSGAAAVPFIYFQF